MFVFSAIFADHTVLNTVALMLKCCVYRRRRRNRPLYGMYCG